MAKVFGLGEDYAANFTIARNVQIFVWALKKTRRDNALSPLQSPRVDRNTPTNDGLGILRCQT